MTARFSLPRHPMARSIWSGHISFGLVTIPVGLHSAVEAEERVHFRMLHRKDMAPIRYKKICSKEKSRDPERRDREGLRGPQGQVCGRRGRRARCGAGGGWRRRSTIDILQFVEFSSLNPLLFEKPYYLAPEKGGARAYALLRDALAEAKKVGVARFYLRTRPLLAALVPSSNVLSLEVIRPPSELRSPSHLRVENVRTRDNERKMALSLIEQMSGEWDATEHPNVYRRALEKLLPRSAPSRSNRRTARRRSRRAARSSIWWRLSAKSISGGTRAASARKRSPARAAGAKARRRGSARARAPEGRPRTP
jgi:DNA end-binding protein Ku